MSPVADRNEPAFSGIFSRTFLLFLGVMLLLAWLARRWGADSLLDPDAAPRVITPRGDLAADEASTIRLFELASPAVCHIQTSLRQSGIFEVPEGSGSGFVWDEAGHIVTNAHVVAGSDAAVVRLHDDTSWRARLVGMAPDYDLAVLKIDAPVTSLVPLPLGTSSDLRVGQKVFAIGNPFGLDQTLTTGVISGVERSIQSLGDLAIHGVIQTDAAINPGNSGGPLLDSAGRLIGVNTAISTRSGTSSGVGFAVPVDTVNRQVPRILAEGNIKRAVLGIVVGPDLWASERGLEGAVVDYVVPRGPAQRAGLAGTTERRNGEIVLGDVIVGLDEFPITGREDLFAALESYKRGDRVQVSVLRPADDGRTSVRLEVELDEVD